jgi:hypothetical protein
MQDRFVVTHIDTTTGAGFVRQVTSKDRQVLTRPIAFDARHLCEAFDHPQDGIAIRTPSREIAMRMPTFGTDLIGSIAFNLDPREMALDAAGNPFLRNWTYADHYDAVQVDATAHMSSGTPDPLEGYSDLDDEEVTTGEVYSRALRCFGGNRELARETASQFPGDFI